MFLNFLYIQFYFNTQRIVIIEWFVLSLTELNDAIFTKITNSLFMQISFDSFTSLAIFQSFQLFSLIENMAHYLKMCIMIHKYLDVNETAENIKVFGIEREYCKYLQCIYII